jgi:uncharacterized protein with FMN-binding domain
MTKIQRLVTGTVGALALAVPAGGALAATQKKAVVVTRKVTGTAAQADRWGYVQVTLTVRKTTTTVGTKKKVTRKIVKVTVPQYPNHTDRSVYINQTALPYLIQETLQAQNANIQMVSGASDSSYAFIQSLQAALVLERKV